MLGSEAVTSDVQLQKAAVGVLAFLITPGLLMPIQMVQAFELAAIRFPAMLEPMTRLMATICIACAMATIAAKLTAMGLFLLLGAAAIMTVRGAERI